MKHMIGFSLLLASWLQPLHVGPWVSWHSEFLAFCALIWFALAERYTRLRSHGGSSEVPTTILLPVGLTILVFAQYIIARVEFFGDAVLISGYLLACAMAMQLGYQWSDRSGLVKAGSDSECLSQLAITITVGASLSVVIALVQIFDVWEGMSWIVKVDGIRRPGGNIAQANHLATLMVMGLLSIIYLQQIRKLNSGIAGFLLGLMALGLILTESRSGLLSLGGVTVWWLYRRKEFVGRCYLPLIVIVIWMLVLLGFWAWPKFITAWFYEDGAMRSLTSIGARQDAWALLIESIWERPWGGWGAGSVAEAMSAVSDNHAVSGPFTYAHNVLLDLTVGFGLPIALVVCLLVARWMFVRLRQVRTMSAWYAMGMVIPLALHSMLEYPFAYAYLLLPVMLCIGHLEAAVKQHSSLSLNTHVITLFVFILVLGQIWVTKEYIEAEEDYRVARFEALKVGKTPDEYERPRLIVLTQLDAMLRVTRLTPSPGMSAEQLEDAREVAEKYLWSALQNRYALSLALNGQKDEAVRQMKVIRAMHGVDHYEKIKLGWTQLAREKYPQLGEVALP